MKKILLFILNHSTKDNATINNEVEEKLIEPLIKLGQGIEDFIIESEKIITIKEIKKTLNEKIEAIEKYTDGDYELYLHFSGHGVNEGHFYGHKKLSSSNIEGLLNGIDRKIKFVFFSNCFSAQLAEMVSKNTKIALTIGTVHKLGVQFSINFEKDFYSRLLNDKWTFNEAFKKTFSALTVDFRDKILEHDKGGEHKYNDFKGGGAAMDFFNIINDIHCFWNKNTPKNNFQLLHKTLSEKINFFEKFKFPLNKKQILIIDNNEEEIPPSHLRGFLREEGWAKVNHIITLDKISKENLTDELKNTDALKPKGSQSRDGQLNFDEEDLIIKMPIKFLQLTSKIPDSNSWLKHEKIAQNLDSKIHLLILSSHSAFNPKVYPNFCIKLKPNGNSFDFNSNKNLINFLSKGNLSFESRFESTLNVPCGKSTNEIQKIYDKQDQHIELVVSDDSNIEIFNFFINKLKYNSGCLFPVIFFDDCLEKNISTQFSELFRLYLNGKRQGKLNYYIDQVFNEGIDVRFFSLRLYNIKDVEEKFNELKEILIQINNNFTEVKKDIGIKRIYFFINTNSKKLIEKLKKIEAEGFTDVKLNLVPKVDGKISCKLLDKWFKNSFPKEEDRDIAKKIICLDQLYDSTPNKIIRSNCDNFLIPEEQFFKI